MQQRGLLDLVKGRGAPPDDTYLKRVARSRELAMVRSIARWWRAYTLERQCPFTSKLLRREERFDRLVADYFDANATSPFAEEVGLDFLRRLEATEAPLTRAVARFDRALLELRMGSGDDADLRWDRHPGDLFTAIESGGALPPVEVGSVYRMRVLGPAPGRIECVRERQLAEP